MLYRCLITAAIVAIAGVPAAMAAKPPKGSSSVTLDAKPTTLVFSQPAILSGRLSGNAKRAGVRVVLEMDAARPYGDDYRRTNIATTTDRNGAYRFALKPATNTQFRAVAQSSPSVTSNPKLILVRPQVGLRISSTTPLAGSSVRFSGSVFPALDGHRALVQRRASRGWVTVGRTTLLDAGDARSTYSKRVRVRRDGVYRVKVVGDADHVNGLSRTRAISVR